MKGGWSYEQKMLISEQLIQGTNFAKQLKVQLNSPSSAETREVLIQGILNSFEKSLRIFRWNGPIKCQPQPVAAAALGTTSVPASPLSVNGNPRLEGPQDGYSWRKYGQKDILGAKYPRSYYRCTYRNTKNCPANKQVQRSDHDHTMFEITYRGKHTCIHGGPLTAAPTSPKKHELKQADHGNHQQDALTKFRTGLRVETENLDGGSDVTDMPYPFSFPSSSAGLLHFENYSPSGLAYMSSHGGNGNLSSPFLSPSTPEGLINSRPRSESDLTELFSTTNSSTNSPIPEWEFSLKDMGIDPNFPFDIAGFLP
ncbi:hypothetical protein SAY86_022623 [Trapa natans]|uniref:WRKY domain-containing protein n=1 Tax=Trapa natans TaxID=22666 RepID=A0AAN7M5W5_TRANT|nr:hypothetical protein SAY86_022623 [Trapa natans]